jgi:hypothetical protein
MLVFPTEEFPINAILKTSSEPSCFKVFAASLTSSLMYSSLLPSLSVLCIPYCFLIGSLELYISA